MLSFLYCFIVKGKLISAKKSIASTQVKLNIPQLTLGELHVAQLDGVASSIPTGCKLFAEINLLFATKQYKNDNIANFVYLWENSNSLKYID